jgi:uncharacterized BrkB/YihY/UPF0761 family membrane protein
MSKTETRIFRIFAVIVAIIFVGFSIANVAYFNQIKNGECTTISQGAATSMYIVNIILLIVAIFLFIWALYRLIFGKVTRNKANQYVIGDGGLISTTYTVAPVSTKPLVL